MKTKILSLGLVAVSFSFLFTGCAERRVVVRERTAVVRSSAEVEVVEAPPAPREEYVTVSPSPAHFWIVGHWAWEGHWVWIPGHWELRPRPHAVWIPGHWDHRGGRGHVWVGGYWR